MPYSNNRLTRVPLPESHIHLWLVFPDTIQDPNLLLAYQNLLSRDEKDKQRRFYFAKHRHYYLIARALVRTTLSRYTEVPPERLTFVHNSYGRPEIAAPHRHHPAVRFSLSHTDGLIGLAVALECNIGLDIEDSQRRDISIEEADHFLSAIELSNQSKIPPERRRDHFFNCWVLKEAYMKACGKGLSIPLKQFSISLTDGQPIRIFFHAPIIDSPLNWCFFLMQPTDRHKVGLAVRRDHSAHCRLRINKVIPLQHEYGFVNRNARSLFKS